MFSSINTIWVLLSAILVFFMQAGFAMVETGFTRSKNAGNIIMKNIMDFCIGAAAFWMVGFGIMFGKGNDFIGKLDFFSEGNYAHIVPTGISQSAFLLFEIVFCATAATIVSGAMAGRTKYAAYCIYSVVISLIIYPLTGHWIWGGGWLAQAGFHDLAGSTAVHLVGGMSALVGASVLGPRLGKYTKDGKAKAIPGHNITIGALGVFILWFGWYGFNGGSLLSITGDAKITATSNILVNTTLSAAFATITIMLATWIKYKKPDVTLTLNGAISGLVAITAGADVMSPKGAAITGILAGATMLIGVFVVEKILKVDDPVGAIAVHGFSGALGTLLVGVFSTKTGLVYTGSFMQLGVQFVGVIAVGGFVYIAMNIVFRIINLTVGLRVAAKDEIRGLDQAEHNLNNAYAGLITEGISHTDLYYEEKNILPDSQLQVPRAKILRSEEKLTRISIVINQERFEELKVAMNDIGVTGMTVTQVMGCGIQKGQNEYYRGSEMEMNLLPKVKVDIVISKVPLEDVITAAKKVLYTGEIGDGKIFVYDVENVFKVRTGDQDYKALQEDV